MTDLNNGSIPEDIDVVVAPPFIFLDWVRANIKPEYQVAAQNCWVKSDGAFTGEISAEMLVDTHVPWVITGHSERRSLCGESNTFVGQKTGHALEVGLKVSRNVEEGCRECSCQAQQHRWQQPGEQQQRWQRLCRSWQQQQHNWQHQHQHTWQQQQH